MKYSTTKTYTLKRSIIEFGKRIFKGLSRPGQKFGVDMIYGMPAAHGCRMFRNRSQTLYQHFRIARSARQPGTWGIVCARYPGNRVHIDAVFSTMAEEMSVSDSLPLSWCTGRRCATQTTLLLC